MRDGKTFVAPDANDIVWAQKWADFAAFHFERHGNSMDDRGVRDSL
jgi:hypothetical protein